MSICPVKRVDSDIRSEYKEIIRKTQPLHTEVEAQIRMESNCQGIKIVHIFLFSSIVFSPSNIFSHLY